MKPCKRGHTGPRYKSGQCIECSALRKGKGRELPPDRAAATVRAVGKLNRLTREELKLRREQARTQRRKLKAENDAAAKAARDAEMARFHAKEAERELRIQGGGKLPPTLTVKVEAPEPVAHLEDVRVDSEGHVTRTPVFNRDGALIPAVPKAVPVEAPQPPASVVPQTNLPEHMLPVWTREGRRPTRQELAAAHAGLKGSSAEYREFCYAGNGTDDTAGPLGIRVPVVDDSRDAWRLGGPGWSKRL